MRVLIWDWRDEELVFPLGDHASPVSLRSSPSHNDTGEKKKKIRETSRVVRHVQDQRDSDSSFSFIFPIPSPCLNPWMLIANMDTALQVASIIIDPRTEDTKNLLPYVPRLQQTRLLVSICNADLWLEFPIEMPWV